VIDAYHVWWEPDLRGSLRGAAGRVFGFHVCDWLLETPDMLAGRGMMGDGVIDLRALREEIDRLGYRGPIEVEVLNREIWAMEPRDAISLARERFDAHVA
jgi:sugar phosphate isomerase/epimerase